jgi:ribosome-binding protein aMBF1 (putative translation factor)
MEIALKVRVNQGLVSHWEQGKSEPDAEMQSRLERLLGAPTTSAHAAAPLPHDP